MMARMHHGDGERAGAAELGVDVRESIGRARRPGCPRPPRAWWPSRPRPPRCREGGTVVSSVAGQRIEAPAGVLQRLLDALERAIGPGC